MRRGMRVAFGLVLLLCILIGGGYAFMSQASFGKLPEGERLDAISQSPHYEGGAFRNTEPLPPIKGNGGIVGALMKYVFSSTEGQKPTRPIPSAKTDLRGLDRNTDTVVWLGHSTYFVQLGGRRLLIDRSGTKNGDAKGNRESLAPHPRKSVHHHIPASSL